MSESDQPYATAEHGLGRKSGRWLRPHDEGSGESRLTHPGRWNTAGFAVLYVVVFTGMALAGSIPLAAIAICLLGLAVLCLSNTLVAIAILLISMLLSPEIRLQDGILLRGEDVVVPLLILVLIVRVCVPRFGFRFRFSPLDRAVLLLIIINAIGSLKGGLAGYVEWQSSLLWNLKILQLFMIAWIIFNYVRDPARVRIMVKLAIVVLITVTVYSFIQIPGTEIHTINRLSAPFEGNPEPTTLGGYLTLQLALVASFAIHETRRSRQMLLWGLSLLILVPILFTLSRTTYVSCLFMFVMLCVFARKFQLTMALVGALLMAPILLPAKVVSRVLMTFDPSRPYGVDSSLAERIDVWKKVGNTLWHRPMFGYGIPQPIIDSQYARTLIESGILGTLAWLLVFAVCIRQSLRLRRMATDTFHQAIGTAHAIGTMVILTHALAASTFYIVRIMEPYWFLTGIVLSLNAWYVEQAAAERDTWGPLPPSAYLRHGRGPRLRS